MKTLLPLALALTALVIGGQMAQAQNDENVYTKQATLSAKDAETLTRLFHSALSPGKTPPAGPLRFCSICPATHKGRPVKSCKVSTSANGRTLTLTCEY